jgi:hypothetical protein
MMTKRSGGKREGRGRERERGGKLGKREGSKEVERKE